MQKRFKQLPKVNLRGNTMKIRVVTEDDAPAIQRIYAPYVKNTAVTFEYDAPDVDEFVRRIEDTVKEYPYLVAEDNGKVVGYAYASPFHSRIAYRHSAEVSIYVDEEWRGKGIGSLLYRELECRLIRQNVFVVYACIARTERENDEHLSDASIRFHNKAGYTVVGTHNLCGYKFDKWYSVVWMEKVIGERPEKPEMFIPFSEID